MAMTDLPFTFLQTGAEPMRPSCGNRAFTPVIKLGMATLVLFLFLNTGAAAQSTSPITVSLSATFNGLISGYYEGNYYISPNAHSTSCPNLSVPNFCTFEFFPATATVTGQVTITQVAGQSSNGVNLYNIAEIFTVNSPFGTTSLSSQTQAYLSSSCLAYILECNPNLSAFFFSATDQNGDGVFLQPDYSNYNGSSPPTMLPIAYPKDFTSDGLSISNGVGLTGGTFYSGDLGSADPVFCVDFDGGTIVPPFNHCAVGSVSGSASTGPTCTCGDIMSNMTNEVNVSTGLFPGQSKSWTGQNTAIFGSFQPLCKGQVLSLSQALQICQQYTAFDWQQVVGATPATVKNVSGLSFGPAPPAFLDPPPGGYAYQLLTQPFKVNPANPFYDDTDPNDATWGLPNFEATTANPEITCEIGGMTGSDPNTLCFADSPQLSILTFLSSLVSGGGFYQGFTTSLVGIKSGGSGNPNSTFDTLYHWSWVSNYVSDAAGGVTKVSNPFPVDSPGAGGVTVLDINGVPSVVALSSGTTCNGNFDGTFSGNVTISAGQNCTFTPSCEITGNVTIDGGSFNLPCTVDGNVTENGGSLILEPGAQVKGNVQISQASTVTLAHALIGGNLQIQNLAGGLAQGTVCGVQVNGNLQVQNNASSMEIGGTTQQNCIGNTVGGNLQVQNNTAAVSIDYNTIAGALHIDNDSATTDVSGNSVGKDLECQNDNSVTYVAPNMVSGQAQGQCAAFP
jgi:hypothetical protein